MRKCLLGLLLLSSCLLPAPIVGCAGAIPLIHDVATVVAEITGYLSQAQDVVERAPESALKQEVLARIDQVRDALARTQAALRIVDEVARNKAYQAAVDDVIDAYTKLLDVGQPFGLRPAGASDRSRLSANRGVVLMPGIAELRADLQAGGS